MQRISIDFQGDINAHIESEVSDEEAISKFRELKRLLQPDGAPTPKRKGRRGKNEAETNASTREDGAASTLDASSDELAFGDR